MNTQQTSMTREKALAAIIGEAQQLERKNQHGPAHAWRMIHAALSGQVPSPSAADGTVTLSKAEHTLLLDGMYGRRPFSKADYEAFGEVSAKVMRIPAAPTAEPMAAEKPQDGALLPCPWCGGKAGVLTQHGVHQACCADFQCPSIGTYETKEEAVRVWNTRATVPDNAGKAAILWCAHVRGMDDLIAVASYEAAVSFADKINRSAAPNAIARGTFLPVYPMPWPHSPESHARALADQLEGK